MAKITKIVTQTSNKDRVSIFIDYEFCTGAEKRAVNNLNLFIGKEIDCNTLKEKINFFWKNAYKDLWKKEKERIKKVCSLIKNVVPEVSLEITGFGAKSDDIIYEHPDEKGRPDIEVFINIHSNKKRIVLLYVEVSGTDKMRGYDYWVRPDKLQYAQTHPEDEVWIILYYNADNRYVFIKPDVNRRHTPVAREIKGNEEHYVVFKDSDKEVKNLKEFSARLYELVKKYNSR